MSSDFSAARRLHAILAVLASGASNRSARDVWQTALGVNDDLDIALGIVALRSLFGDVGEQIVAHYPRQYGERYLEALGEAQRVLSIESLNAPWNERTTILHSSLLMRIEMIADNLEDKFAETRIAEDELAALRTAVEALRSEIAGLEVDGRLRRFLYECATDMLRAIDQYPITGAPGLVAAFGGEFGKIYFSRIRELDDPALTGFFEKLKGVRSIIEHVAVEYGKFAPLVEGLLRVGAYLGGSMPVP